jgi:hypothetical protein
MNKFVYCTLAATMASGLGFAGPGSEDWSTLDKDIENLASSITVQDSGLALEGFIRSIYSNSSDITVNGNDLGGFTMANARLELNGSVADYGMKIQLDAGTAITGSNTATLLDAYGTFAITDQISGQMGQFRPPFLWSSQLDEDEFILLSRPINGGIWSARDNGLMFTGTFSQLGVSVAAQNGNDGAGDELAFTGRVDFDVLGAGIGMVEGAYGADEGSNMTVGVAIYDDGNLSDGTALGFDAGFVSGAFSVYGEVADYDADFTFTIPGTPIAVGDTTPYSVTAGFMVSPEEWEVAARYEDADDTNDTTRITVGVNYYVQGHAAKWSLNYDTIDSDLSLIEADIISVGLTVSV